MIELKSCPFCSSKNLRVEPHASMFEEDNWVEWLVAWVQCEDCTGMGPAVEARPDDSGETLLDAARLAWNGSR